MQCQQSSEDPETPVEQDDLTAHLQVVRAEFIQTVAEMESINATTAAAAYYDAQLTCERFLISPACFP